MKIYSFDGLDEGNLHLLHFSFSSYFAHLSFCRITAAAAAVKYAV
jgi:hypothetical protein